MSYSFGFNIRNFRSIKLASVEVSHIALITGPNHSGKTSVLNAVAACLLGDRKVYAATEKDQTPVVQDGESQASIAVTSANWDRAISWPGDIIGNDIDMPNVDKVSMGLVDPARDFKKAEWAAFVRSIAPSKAKLTFADVQAKIEKEIGEANPDYEHRETDYQEIKDALQGGWDGATTLAKQSALKMRRDWENRTNEKFGTNKAEVWLEDGYIPGDDLTSLADLKANWELLADELAIAKSREDVIGGQKEDLEAHLAEMQEDQFKITESLETLRTKINGISKALSFYPSSAPLECPDCGCKLQFKNGKLEKFIATAHIFGSPDHQAYVSGKIEAVAEYEKLAVDNGVIRAKIAAEMSMLKKIGTFDESVRDVGVIDAEFQQAKRRHNACQTTMYAKIAFARWKLFSTAEQQLGAGGLRFEATKEAVESLKPRIEEISRAVFPGYDVDLHTSEEGIEIRFDGRSYESMTWNGDPNSFALGVQILCQFLALDTWSMDCPILIDRFDMLEIARRGSILAFLVRSGRPAIIGQTTSKKLDVDKLALKGVGKTYFINDGVVEPI